MRARRPTARAARRQLTRSPCPSIRPRERNPSQNARQAPRGRPHGAKSRRSNRVAMRPLASAGLRGQREAAGDGVDMSINPALADLEPLVGRWRMELRRGFLPGPDSRVTGSIEIDWIEAGSGLRMRQGDSDNPPAAVWIIGRDGRASDSGTLGEISRPRCDVGARLQHRLHPRIGIRPEPVVEATQERHPKQGASTYFSQPQLVDAPSMCPRAISRETTTRASFPYAATPAPNARARSR